jgi:hypothetical protein
MTSMVLRCSSRVSWSLTKGLVGISSPSFFVKPPRMAQVCKPISPEGEKSIICSPTEGGFQLRMLPACSVQGIQPVSTGC